MRRVMPWGAAVLALAVGVHQRAWATTVAVGTVYEEPRANGSYETRPLILVRENKAWRSVVLNKSVAEEAGVLMSVTTGVGDSLWAMGQSEEGTTLFRSLDGARTWEDLTRSLPLDAQRGLRGRSLAVGAEGSLWLLASDLLGVGPYLWRTTDDAKTWTAIDTRLDRGMGPFVLTSNSSGPGAFMMRGDDNRPQVIQLPVAGPAKDLGQGRMRLLAGAARGQRLWAAGAVFDSSSLTTTPRILRSTDNVVWTQGSVPEGTDFEPRVISFSADGTSGVTCGGVGPEISMLPACFYSSDGGRTWKRGQLVEPAWPATILAAGLADAKTGYAVAMKLGQPGSLFYETEDGGASWQRVATEFDESTHVRALLAE